jgi:pimeloyl-ACP methyl ester carboxylesterase
MNGGVPGTSAGGCGAISLTRRGAAANVDSVNTPTTPHANRTTILLIPGAGGDSRDWFLVTPLLRERGWTVVAPDLPSEDESAGIEEYADAAATALAASGDYDRLIVVAQSLGAFTAIALAERVHVDRIVFVGGMIPAPGETAGEWWDATGQAEAKRENDVREDRDPDAPWDDDELFYHDLPADLLAQVQARDDRGQTMRPFDTPHTWTAWRGVPAASIVGAHDRLFPLEFEQRLARERLGVEPRVLDAGHVMNLSRPGELAEAIAAEVDLIGSTSA